MKREGGWQNIRQVLIQVKFDLQAVPPILRLNTRRKPVRCPE
jgi:hypothetical protein